MLVVKHSLHSLDNAFEIICVVNEYIILSLLRISPFSDVLSANSFKVYMDRISSFVSTAIISKANLAEVILNKKRIGLLIWDL